MIPRVACPELAEPAEGEDRSQAEESSILCLLWGLISYSYCGRGRWPRLFRGHRPRLQKIFLTVGEPAGLAVFRGSPINHSSASYQSFCCSGLNISFLPFQPKARYSPKQMTYGEDERMETIRKENVLQDLKRFQREFGPRYGILSLGLFGSLARDAASEDSDIDIVVRLKEPNLFTLSRIRIELEERLHRHVDIVSYRERMNPFLKNRIQQEACYV